MAANDNKRRRDVVRVGRSGQTQKRPRMRCANIRSEPERAGAGEEGEEGGREKEHIEGKESRSRRKKRRRRSRRRRRKVYSKLEEKVEFIDKQ